MKVTAKLNHLHISPRKVRAVVNVVKKFKPEEAVAQLNFIPNRASRPLQKLIRSGIANAENNFSLAAEGLKISIFKVDGGPVFKRFRPNSRGRTSPLKKRTSHITLILEGERTATKKAVEPKDDLAAGTHKNEGSEKNIAKDDNRKNRTIKGRNPNQKSSGFVKKMFQRKSI